MPPSPDDPTSLRRRQPSEEKILADAPRSVETAAPDPSQSTNIPAVPTRLGVSRGIISIILAILTLSVYRLCPRSLPAVPKSYVLCSRDGDYIYTVDDAHPRVQCLAVHQSRFVAAGSLRKSLCFSSIRGRANHPGQRRYRTPGASWFSRPNMCISVFHQACQSGTSVLVKSSCLV